jgi:alpha-L-arabinofuranosidase
MGAFTTGVSTLDITPSAAVLNSTGEVFELYGEHFGAGTVPLALDGNAPQPEPKYPTGFDHPKVRAGSSTYPLDVIAGLSPDGTRLRIAAVNPTLDKQVLAIQLVGLVTRGTGTVWRLTGASLDAANHVGQPPGVTVRQSAEPALSRALVLPPISMAIYEFSVAAKR